MTRCASRRGRRYGRTATASIAASAGAGILRRNVPDTLDQPPSFSAMRAVRSKRDRLARMFPDLVNFRVARRVLPLTLCHVHGAAAHDRAPACAGAEFCKSHFDRHNHKPRLTDRLVAHGPGQSLSPHRAAKLLSRKQVNRDFTMPARIRCAKPQRIAVNVPFRGCFAESFSSTALTCAGLGACL